jgi:hypothetical protein
MMPKPLNEFSLADWCRLRPLTQGVKTARYKVIDRAYRRRPATSGDVASVARSVSGHKLLVTIAFDDPELIWWQTRLLRHYIPRTFHLIVDNTTTDEIALEIRRVAAVAGAGYLRAPANPWSGNAASRSHGIALNWTWQNVIRPGEPAAFGFLDHDIFPTALDDPFAPLAEQDVYGVIRQIGSRWFLWAGFCMFRFAAVRHKALDFGQDWFIGLDTGGGNWRRLYRGIERETLREQPTHFVPFKVGVALADGPLQWCGTWLHEIGLMGDRRLAAEKRAAVLAVLGPHLEAATKAVYRPSPSPAQRFER